MPSSRRPQTPTLFPYTTLFRSNRVVAYNVANRTPLGTYSNLSQPSGVDVDPVSGHVFVADTLNDRVVELTATSGGSFSLVRTYTADRKSTRLNSSHLGISYAVFSPTTDTYTLSLHDALPI